MNSKKKKGFTIVELVVIGVVLITFLVFLIIEMAAPASSVGEWVKENVYSKIIEKMKNDKIIWEFKKQYLHDKS